MICLYKITRKYLYGNWLREEMKPNTSLSNEQVAVIALLIHQLIVHLDWAADA